MKFASFDGTELHYTDVGKGTPILCLSGLTRTGEDFRYVAPQLTGYRMITMDYRGRGRSDWADHSTYSIPVESQDALALLDHLGIAQAAILGTSRGGLIAMGLAATVKHRLLGVCLNDIGPVIEPSGMEDIANYLGRRPSFQTYDDAAAARARLLPGFDNVPHARWHEEVRLHYVETDGGLDITYDPKLRDAVLGADPSQFPDLWPMFDAFAGLPLALIRGANSNLLSYETAQEMARRMPQLIWVDVPDRGHVPFLDEPESQTAISKWLKELP